MQMTTAAAYSEEHVLAYPVEYLAGIDLYNAGEFHAAHDAWEERWMGPVDPQEKLFHQAMIQSAVAFHHLQIGRPGAARQMYLAAKEKFAKLGVDVFMSLDLSDYQAELDRAGIEGENNSLIAASMYGVDYRPVKGSATVLARDHDIARRSRVMLDRVADQVPEHLLERRRKRLERRQLAVVHVLSQQHRQQLRPRHGERPEGGAIQLDCGVRNHGR